MEQAALEGWLAAGLSVEAIARKVGRNPSTVSYWMKKFELEAPLRQKYAAKGPLEKAQLVALISEGLSIAELADRLDRSKATVRHWLRRFELRTTAADRIDEIRTAKALGITETTLDCAKHGETSFTLDRSGGFRCRKCRAEGVSRRRRAVKRVLVAEAGGRCAICGYDQCAAALHFHHVDPSAKRLHLSNNGRTVALQALRAEAIKCVLLCANCHAEVEAGVTMLPLEFGPT